MINPRSRQMIGLTISFSKNMKNNNNKKKSAVVTSGGRRPRGSSQSISVMRRTPSSNLSTKIIIELHQEFVRMHLDVPHLACSFNLY